MWNIYYIIVQGYVIRMELKVDLTENKSASMHSPQGFQLLGGKPACRDSFARIGLVEKFSSLAVEKEELTYSVLCWLVTSPRSLRKGVNVLVWLVAIPRPLRERVQSCSSRQAKATNAGVGLKTIIHEYPPTVSDHFPLKGGRCLRLQSTSFVFPCPLGENGQIHPTYFVILSPASIQVRRIFKTLQKGDSSGFRPQNDGTLVSLASPRPLGERVEFQVERERKLEIRVRGFKTFTPHKLRRCA